MKMRLNFTAVPLLLLFQLLFSRFISAQEAVSDEQIPLIQTNESSDPAVLMIRDKENSINDSCINMPAVREENVAVNAFEEYDDDDDEDDYDDDEEDDDYDDFPLNFNEWGKPQIIRDEAVEARIQSTRRYMEEVIFAGTHEGKYECRNDHIECSAWASRGMCETNEEYSE